MEQSFDIKKIIEQYKLDVDEVAAVLFPHVRYTKLAFDRVLRGETSLDVEQLQALANLAGVFIHDLFTFDDWKGSSENGYLTFTRGEYKVKLNYNGVCLSIYKGKDLVHQELALQNMNMPEFIEYINQIINNQNGNN